MATARRAAPRAGGSTNSAVSSGFHGAEGRRKMEEEDERQTARREAQAMNTNMPFRFFCPVGETREVVVVDDAPNFFRYEHNLKDNRSGKWSIFCACVNENANCPVCKASERPSYYAMYLTVIDLTPYTSEKHGEVEWSKKLMVVKSAQQKKITRLWERHGSLRGMVLSMTRDGEKDASIGNDIEFVEFLEEDALLAYETTFVYQKEGKDMERDVIGHEPCEYDELFPMPTEQQLRAIVGGRPEAGSREEADGVSDRRSSGRGRAADGWDDGQQAAPRTRAAGHAPAPAPAPARRTFAAAAAPAPSAATRRPTRAAPEQEGEEADEVPQRSATRAPVRAAPPTRAAPPPRGRAAPEQDEEEDAPQRSAVNLADRRRALRR